MRTDKLGVNKKKWETSLEAFLVCRLIPVNKNPGLGPAGTGEKGLMKIVKENITKALGFFKLSAVLEAGNEAAINIMHSTFEGNKIFP